jgi:hypothetical protein
LRPSEAIKENFALFFSILVRLHFHAISQLPPPLQLAVAIHLFNGREWCECEILEILFYPLIWRVMIYFSKRNHLG